MLAEAAAICLALVVVDGDTVRCGAERVRIHAIDAPETHSCPRNRVCTPGDSQASKRALAGLLEGRTVTIQRMGKDRYRRTVAKLTVEGVDVGCWMVANGWAVERYGKLRCK